MNFKSKEHVLFIYIYKTYYQQTENDFFFNEKREIIYSIEFTACLHVLYIYQGVWYSIKL